MITEDIINYKKELDFLELVRIEYECNRVFITCGMGEFITNKIDQIKKILDYIDKCWGDKQIQHTELRDKDFYRGSPTDFYIGK